MFPLTDWVSAFYRLTKLKFYISNCLLLFLFKFHLIIVFALAKEPWLSKGTFTIGIMVLYFRICWFRSSCMHVESALLLVFTQQCCCLCFQDSRAQLMMGAGPDDSRVLYSNTVRSAGQPGYDPSQGGYNVSQHIILASHRFVQTKLFMFVLNTCSLLILLDSRQIAAITL